MLNTLLRSFVISSVFLSSLVSHVYGEQQPLQIPATAADWDALKAQVGGRLFPAIPFSKPCYENADSEECQAIQKGYGDDVFRSQHFGAYVNTNWETCQATGAECLLNSTNPLDGSPTTPPHHCQLGAVPSHYIDIEGPNDVAAAFDFSRKTGVHVLVKNTGHDYKGRSSAPNSLALWTHNLKTMSYNPNFVPEGCPATESKPGATLGAGVQWGEAYPWAEENNITLVGGSDKGVGAVGGWLQGGGHGALTNTMGLGVDRALEFKIVTPDGKYRIANACQNKDLFWALRGGGGGTFGVVLEATVLASPPVALQVFVVLWENTYIKRTRNLWSILVDNAIRWADEGWGGFVNGQSAIYINPKLSKEEAAKSMTPLTNFGKKLVESERKAGRNETQVQVLEFPSWGTFFDAFASTDSADIGMNLALTSRLIPRSSFSSYWNRWNLKSALGAAHALAPGLRFLVSPPSTFQSLPGTTSVTEAWRDSVYHITLVESWGWNATKAEMKDKYETAKKAIDHLRTITPDAAYSNEADVYEPNHEVSFWGKNYPELMRVKGKYDPDHLLDCWQCVGWNPESSRFSCYLR